MHKLMVVPNPFASDRCDDDPADVLQQIESYIRNYCVLPAAAYLPLATWALATWSAERFDCIAYIALTSPSKRCGKSRVLETLERLCARPWRGTAPSAASLFRMMADVPTLLLDEVEGLRNSKGSSETQQAIIACLNAGHRKGATVPRCDGKDNQLKFFPVFGPKAFACIGGLPDTLMDRSLVITMQRRGADQPVARFLYSRAEAEGKPIVAAVSQWTRQNAEDVRRTYETQPDLHWLSDRDADLWAPLFAIVATAAPERTAELKQCSIVLSNSKEEDDVESSLALRLLADLRSVWPEDAPYASTATLLEGLLALDEAPWTDYETNERKVAKWLRPFDVRPRTVRIGGNTPKGYVRVELEPVWRRYVPSSGSVSATTATTRINVDENYENPSATTEECGGKENGLLPA